MFRKVKMTPPRSNADRTPVRVRPYLDCLMGSVHGDDENEQRRS